MVEFRLHEQETFSGYNFGIENPAMASNAGFLTEEQRSLMCSVWSGKNILVREEPEVCSGDDCLKNLSSSPRKSPKVISQSVKEKKSHSGRNGRPKKCGWGRKGAWGTPMEDGIELHTDYSDPNYDSEEAPFQLIETPVARSLEEFKEKVVLIATEYFTNGNVDEAANDLRELASPNHHHYFVKKLISMAMDRHDREKEMAAVLLSALYADVINPEQLSKGFERLLDLINDLVLDIPDAVDTLALFLARAVVDDILPPSFLDYMKNEHTGRGLEALEKAEKSYLKAPHHAEAIERVWGGSTHTTVVEVKKKIDELLKEYVDSCDMTEACYCIRKLNVPFFHHEIVKRAFILAMENRNLEDSLLSLLKECLNEGLISSSQMYKGVSRVCDSLSDLTLDIPHAKDILYSIISTAHGDGWLQFCSLHMIPTDVMKAPERDEISIYKQKALAVVQEYFLSDDISEVSQSLDDICSPDFNVIFVKKLVMLAMDRKNREKEMASVLLSAELIPSEQVMAAFVSLLDSAEDTILDIPNAGNELAFFLARVMIDDVIPPVCIEEMNMQLEEGTFGKEIIRMTKSLFSAVHGEERILRCWGGSSGWAIEDAKEKIMKLLEEFDSGGDFDEACECIRDLNMPFFHHEVVNAALIMAMEKQNDQIFDLLMKCADEGLITTSQMTKGFNRVIDHIDDLSLDIPDAKQKIAHYVDIALAAKWLTFPGRKV